MKKIIFTLLTLLFLTGCQQEMTNEQIITEKDKCIKAGMDYIVYEGGIGIPYPIRVTCIKPKQAVQPL